ncbi:MAG: D-alanine--D-alanine ligase [Steroidobacteraceae bacterium]
MRLKYHHGRHTHVTEADAFGKVAVLFGGNSSEREISLRSGQAVLAALRRRGVDAEAFDPQDLPLSQLIERGIERVWIALHGPGGEDGSLQGALEFMGLPYTGSGVTGSAVGMDKLLCKRLAEAVGVATSPYMQIDGPDDFDAVVETLGLPLIVKPATQGSSVGMTRVTQAEQLAEAFASAAAFEPRVFAERWINGPEYTVAILQGEALPAIRIEAAGGFYDYQAKYFRTDTRYLIPCGLSAPAEQHLQQLALASFDACSAGGWGRVDFMADDAGRPMLLEINTVPGMTDHSLVPKAALANGIDFDELVWRVLETSFAREPR